MQRLRLHSEIAGLRRAYFKVTQLTLFRVEIAVYPENKRKTKGEGREVSLEKREKSVFVRVFRVRKP